MINPALLFFLSFPILALSSDDLDTSLQAESHHAPIDSAGDATEVKSWKWPSVEKIEEYTYNAFSKPSIVESMKGVLFPPDLDVMKTTPAQPQALALPSSDASPSDFWGTVEKHQDIMQDYVHKLLNSAAASLDSAQFTDITSTVQDIHNVTTTFRDSIQETLRTRGITLDMLTEELESVFTSIAIELETRSLPDETPDCAERANMVDKIIDKAATELESLFQRHGVEEGTATDYMRAVKPHVRTLVVTVCEINERYPCLFFSVLTFCVAVLLIPQGWILKPFLSLFGFGPLGPLKGSAAAWLQRYLWGAAVKPGSFFAWLQAAGMGAIPVWADIVPNVLLAGGLFVMCKLNVTPGSVAEWLQGYF